MEIMWVTDCTEHSGPLAHITRRPQPRAHICWPARCLDFISPSISLLSNIHDYTRVHVQLNNAKLAARNIMYMTCLKQRTKSCFYVPDYIYIYVL